MSDAALSAVLPGHSVSKEDRQLGVDQAPILSAASPLFRDVHHSQIQHFQKAVIGWEHGFSLGHLAKLTVESLNGIGRVNQPPHFLGIFEVGAELVLLQKSRLKLSLSISGSRYFNIPQAGSQSFTAMTVSAVVRLLVPVVISAVAQFVIQFRLQTIFHKLGYGALNRFCMSSMLLTFANCSNSRILALRSVSSGLRFFSYHL